MWREPVVTFLGHKFSKEGVRPDPAKVKAIVEMSAPTSVHELQQILRMINYIGMFIPNLATMMKPMNDLLKKDTQWSWGPAQKKSFEEVKQALVNATTLHFMILTSLSLYLPMLLALELELLSCRKRTIG